VRATLPAGWSGDRERPIDVAFGEQGDVSLFVSPAAESAEGDVQVPVELVDRSGRTLDKAVLWAKIMRVGNDPSDERARAPGAGQSLEAARATSAGAPPGTAPGKASEAILPTSHPTTVCRRVSKPPEVDGVLESGEWPPDRVGSGASPVRLEASTKDNVCVAASRWAWDDDCLYFACEVADDLEVPLGIRDTLYRSDRAHLVLDLDGDRRDDYEIAFVRAADGFLTWPITVGGVFTSTQVAYQRKVLESARGLVAAAGPLRGTAGRVIEAAIPWSWLGGYPPAVGRVAGVAVQVGDVDPRKGLRALVQWPSRSPLPDGPYLSWGRVDKPTAFADLVFTP
jgi:hypothetical protein